MLQNSRGSRVSQEMVAKDFCAVTNSFLMNHFISVTEAAVMTQRYRNQKENILKTNYEGQNLLCISETFDRAPFDTVLGKSGCMGLRIYYGMSEDFKIHAIIVGVDAANADILPDSTALFTEEDDSVIDRAIRCPDLCPEPSPLNT